MKTFRIKKRNKVDYVLIDGWAIGPLNTPLISLFCATIRPGTPCHNVLIDTLISSLIEAKSPRALELRKFYEENNDRKT